jgi:hypothetical protein
MPPAKYAQLLNIECSRLTTAAFIGNADGSEAVMLAISLRTVGLARVLFARPATGPVTTSLGG